MSINLVNVEKRVKLALASQHVYWNPKEKCANQSAECGEKRIANQSKYQQMQVGWTTYNYRKYMLADGSRINIVACTVFKPILAILIFGCAHLSAWQNFPKYQAQSLKLFITS